MTTGAIRRAKFQSHRHHQQTNTQLFTGQMPFLSPNQQCQSTEGNTQGVRKGGTEGLATPNGCILQCQERPSWVLNIVENLCAVGTPPRTPLGAHSAPFTDPFAGGQGVAASPKETHPRS